MAPRDPSKSVQIAPETHAEVVALRDLLAEQTGLPVTLAAAIGRAVGAYTTLLEQGLVGPTAAEVEVAMRERIKRLTTEIVGAIMHHAAPEIGFRGIGWDDQNGTAIAVLDDHAPIAVQVGEPRPEVARAFTN